MLEPWVNDLRETSEEWWSLMIKEVGEWYRHHMSLSPLDRASHSYEPPPSLVQKRWQRLAHKRLGVYSILGISTGGLEDSAPPRQCDDCGLGD